VTRWAAALLGVLFVLLLACGKYGKPVRASEVREAKPPPRVEVPLPAIPGTGAPEAAPPGEEEPPPEGAP
jgi:hypothetical protein